MREIFIIEVPLEYTRNPTLFDNFQFKTSPDTAKSITAFIMEKVNLLLKRLDPFIYRGRFQQIGIF